MKPLLPFRINSNSEVMLWRAETFWTKEPETIAWIQAHCESINPVRFFLDIGANIGMYSLYACSLSQSISIIAVEPAPNNLKYLIENIGLNSFSARFTVIPNPLASRVFNGTLVNPDQRPGASGAQVQDVFSSAGHEITTVTGDLLVQKNGLNDGILKIDVDGNEVDILLGFERSLKEKRFRSVLVELTEFNFNEINLFMLECGLVEDLSYRTLPLHSDSRRKANGKSESNTVFTLR